MYSGTRRKYAALFALIMLACIAVTTSHLYLNELSPWAMSVLTVSTGFLLTAENGREFEENGLSVKRSALFTFGMIKKIYPLYFVCILLALTPYIYFAIGGAYSFDGDMAAAVTLQAFMLQAWSPKYVFSVNGVSWFFSVCVLLFLLFPAVNALVNRAKTRKGLVCLATGAVAVQCAVSICVKCFLPDVDTKWFNIAFPPCRIFDFTLGCAAARWTLCFPQSKTGRIRPTAAELCAIALAFASTRAYFFTAVHSELKWSGYAMIYSLPTMLLVICFARSEGYISKALGNRFFSYLGFLGASVYLVHRVVSDLLLTGMELLSVSERIQRIAVPVLAVIVSFAVAVLWDMLSAFLKKKSRPD